MQWCSKAWAAQWNHLPESQPRLSGGRIKAPNTGWVSRPRDPVHCCCAGQCVTHASAKLVRRSDRVELGAHCRPYSQAKFESVFRLYIRRFVCLPVTICLGPLAQAFKPSVFKKQQVEARHACTTLRIHRSIFQYILISHSVPEGFLFSEW